MHNFLIATAPDSAFEAQKHVAPSPAAPWALETASGVRRRERARSRQSFARVKSDHGGMSTSETDAPLISQEKAAQTRLRTLAQIAPTKLCGASEDTTENRLEVLRALNAALRRERSAAGLGGYNLARHRQLIEIYRVERAGLSASLRALTPGCASSIDLVNL